MQHIIVDPAKLRNVSSIISSQKDEYQRLYMKLFQIVDNLSTYWEGKDNQAFISHIQHFEGDLRKIAIIMSQYSEFLSNSANAYSTTQNELFDEVNRLRN